MFRKRVLATLCRNPARGHPGGRHPGLSRGGRSVCGRMAFHVCLHRRHGRLPQRPQLAGEMVDPGRDARHHRPVGSLGRPGYVRGWRRRQPAAARTRHPEPAAARSAAAERLQPPELGRRPLYTTGTIVRYTNGRYYIAEHDNPGYDPTISTWYWDPYTCGSANPPPPDHRRPAAAAEPAARWLRRHRGAVQPDVPGPQLVLHLQRPDRRRWTPSRRFARTGSDTVRRQEAAAFLANASHETGGLVHITEINTNYPHLL